MHSLRVVGLWWVTTTHFVHGANKHTETQTSQELRMLSRSISHCQSLTLNVMIQVWQFLGIVNYVTKSLNRSQRLRLRLRLRLCHSHFLHQLTSALKRLKLMLRDIESLRTSWRALLTCGKVA